MSVILLDEAKDHLNIPLEVVSDDSELGRFIARAESAMARRTGPLVGTPVTQRVPGGEVLVLRHRAVLSLTSITPVGGTALSLTGLSVDGGIVEYDSGACFPARRYDVAYQAGWGADAASVPEDLKLGVLELLRHLWDTQRGGSPVSAGALPLSDGEVLTGFGGGASFTWPIRVEQLVQPFEDVSF